MRLDLPASLTHSPMKSLVFVGSERIGSGLFPSFTDSSGREEAQPMFTSQASLARCTRPRRVVGFLESRFLACCVRPLRRHVREGAVCFFPFLSEVLKQEFGDEHATRCNDTVTTN